MSWICKSCGCENDSQSNICCNCGTHKKSNLIKNSRSSTNLHKYDNQYSAPQNTSNRQKKDSSSNLPLNRVSHNYKAVNRPSDNSLNQHSRRTSQKVQQTQQARPIRRAQQSRPVRDVQTPVIVSADSQKNREDTMLKIVLAIGTLVVLILLIVFITLLKRNGNDSTSTANSAQGTNITLNTYTEDLEVMYEDTTYTTIPDESTMTTIESTTESTTEMTTDLTTTETIETTITAINTTTEVAAVLTVAPQEITTKIVETTVSTTVATTAKSSDNTPSYSSNFVEYRNNTFGYYVKYPDNFSIASQSEDGCVLTDGYATIRLYASYNVSDKSSKTAYSDAANAISENMYYELVKDRFYIISWVQNNDVMYRKVFVGDTLITLEFQYSTEYKSVYDKMITEMVLIFSTI